MKGNVYESVDKNKSDSLLVSDPPCAYVSGNQHEEESKLAPPAQRLSLREGISLHQNRPLPLARYEAKVQVSHENEEVKFIEPIAPQVRDEEEKELQPDTVYDYDISLIDCDEGKPVARLNLDINIERVTNCS